MEKQREIQRTEQLNQYGIMIGSVLTANLIEARELKSTKLTGSVRPYIVMLVEGQKSTSEVSESADPVWNEIITFDIMTGREDLIIQIFDKSDLGRDTLIGESQVALHQLAD
jgi:Ca2+-dependent lipid-binding protein